MGNLKLLDDLGISPKNIELYKEAFVHTSYANENNIPYNYERLEFLGDSVLDMLMGEYVYTLSSLPEGDMTKLRSSYVCENALYEFALNLHLEDYLLLGHGEELSGGKKKKAILADSLEAFIGALYLDQGFDEVKKFIFETIVPMIKNHTFFVDYKSKLQELVQTNRNSVIYTVINETGPAHNRVFTIEVSANGIALGKGTANSKKEAEQEAARKALEIMAKKEE